MDGLQPRLRVRVRQPRRERLAQLDRVLRRRACRARTSPSRARRCARRARAGSARPRRRAPRGRRARSRPPRARARSAWRASASSVSSPYGSPRWPKPWAIASSTPGSCSRAAIASSAAADSAGERAHGRAELAEQEGGDPALERVAVLGHRARPEQHLLVAAVGERGQVRRPLGLRGPLGPAELEQLVERAAGQRRVQEEAGADRLRAPAQPGARRPSPCRRAAGSRVSSSAPPLQSSSRRPSSARTRPPAGATVSPSTRALEHAHELAARQRQPRADVRAQRAHLALDRLGRRA